MSSANAFQAARKDFNEWYRTTDDYRWEIEQRKAEREAEKAKRAERTAARRAERECRPRPAPDRSAQTVPRVGRPMSGRKGQTK